LKLNATWCYNISFSYFIFIIHFHCL